MAALKRDKRVASVDGIWKVRGDVGSEELTGLKYGWNPWARVRRFTSLRAAFREGRPHVVVVNTTVQATALLAARACGVPVIWWCHESGASLSGLPARMRFWLYNSLASAVVVPSDAVPATRATRAAIPNVVRSFERVCDRSNNLLVLGTKSLVKGTDRIPEIVDELLAMNVRFRLKVVGPEDRRDVAAISRAKAELVDRLGCALDWHGPTMHPGDYLSGAAVLLLPSRADTRPRVVEEALATGVPVVASDLPGVREIAAEALPDSVILCRDHGEFAKGIAGALTRPWVRASLLDKQSSEESIVDEWIKVISELVVKGAR